MTVIIEKAPPVTITEDEPLKEHEPNVCHVVRTWDAPVSLCGTRIARGEAQWLRDLPDSNGRCRGCGKPRCPKCMEWFTS